MRAELISQPQTERVVLGKHLPLKTPFVVYIEPSGYCNLKCVFCPQSSGDKALIKDIMSLELWKKVIDDLAEFPDKVKLLRVCGNGEPLTCPHIAEMLKYAKGKVERIELISNGTLLNNRLIRKLPRYADRIIISIEGLSGEEYEFVSGVKVDLEKLVDNIKRLHANSKDCIVHIKIHHKAVHGKGKKEKFFKLFGNICDEIYIENLIPMWPEFDSEFAIDKFRYGGKFARKKVCVQMFKGFQVQANGEVVPCCVDWKRVNIIGNIRKESVAEVWQGRKLRRLRLLHLSGCKDKIEPCKTCTMNAYNDTDNIDKYATMILEQL